MGLVGQTIVGGGIWRTTTLKLHEAVPQPLVAVQVTVVVPRGKHAPEGGARDIGCQSRAFAVRTEIQEGLPANA